MRLFLEDSTKPKFYRASKGRRISWEIYSWRIWFVTVSIGNLEIQLNRWPGEM